MSELSFDLPFTAFDIVQGYIRHFIGDQRYVDSLILSVRDDNKEIFTKEDDDLVAYLQNPTLPGNIDQSSTYTVSLMHKYTYQFNYYDNNISVNIIVAKDPQNIIISNIPTYNWNNVSEHAKIFTNSMRFFNDILYVIHLRTPDIEHYHIIDKSTNQTINIDQRSADCDKIYSDYKQSKNITTINPKVYQIQIDTVKMLSTNIKNVRANMKTDGIRTLVVIVNNVVQCYQHNDEIVFLYRHQSNINGIFIFDCELCLGQLHLFDCYVYTKDNETLDVSTLPTDERIAYIKEFTDTYNEFIGTDMISGEKVFSRSQYTFMKTAMSFSEFFESKDFNNVISKLNAVAANVNINVFNTFNAPEVYMQWLSLAKGTYPDDEMLQEYVTKLIESIRSTNSSAYKNAYNMCIDLKIPVLIMVTYSPMLVEGLIGYYYQLGFFDNERKIKQYAIQFAKTCRTSGVNLPISFTEMLQEMYDKYQYANDGVIFVMNHPLFDANTIYYKWKPRDKLSADVKLVFDESSVNIPFDGTTNKYVTANIDYTTDTTSRHYNNYTAELLLNNFNQTLPMCENGDIVTNESIVEIVPLFNGVDFSYKLLKIRYDKVNTNAKRTIDTIFNLQRSFINIF